MTSPVPAKKRPIERNTRFCMVPPPLYSASVEPRAAGKVALHEILAVQVTANVTQRVGHDAGRTLEKALDRGKNSNHQCDPLREKNSNIVQDNTNYMT